MTTENLDDLTAPQKVSTAPWCEAAVQVIKPTLSVSKWGRAQTKTKEVHLRLLVLPLLLLMLIWVQGVTFLRSLISSNS